MAHGRLISSLLVGIDLLAQRDHECALFGADFHHHRRLPRVSPGELRAIETALGAALPDEYRAYLLEVSGGGAGPGYGLFYLPALLVDASLDDDAWFEEVARRALTDDEAERWAAARFAPLTDAQIEARLESFHFPATVAAQLRQSAEPLRTSEGRRNLYLADLTNALREETPRGLVPLSNEGDGRRTVMKLGGAEHGQIETLDIETAETRALAPDFVSWMTSWLDTCASELDAGIRRKGQRLWG